RIFKLNQGLMMISKIDNRQFPETKVISLKKLIEKFLSSYGEIMELKKIKITTDLSDRSFCRMNETLADVMISNLLGNAVRYNVDGGSIDCKLDQNVLTIKNSGLPLKVDPETLFDRFGKGTDHPEAVGLGLSIVKKIADHYRMKITYTNSGTVHEVKLVYRGQASHDGKAVS
ncbi:MAG: HAMP domain-containing sensor histidine kinase, partial [Bacteroidales bacterium]